MRKPTEDGNNKNNRKKKKNITWKTGKYASP